MYMLLYMHVKYLCIYTHKYCFVRVSVSNKKVRRLGTEQMSRQVGEESKV